MKLVFPNLELKEQYYDLVKSALRNGDISEMGNAYRENEKYEDMLIRLENRSKGINISSRDVPATVQFILNEKEKVVGTIDIRHTLNDNYFSRLGHIAYYIKLEERNKGYATEALKLALEKLKNEYKVNKVLITCLKNNIASRKVIEANGGIFEKEFLVFLLGVLYVISLKSFVSLRLLKQFLLCFCISVLTFNLVMLFHLGGENWFTAPQTVVQNLYASRFGGTKHFLNGEVYLDAQALQIYAAALIAYFFGIIRTKMGEKVIAFTAFALFVWLLSLTVTKSSILSFLCGFVIFNLYFFRKLSVWQRWMFIGVILLVGISGYIFRPASFDQRWIQLKQEIEDVNNGKLDGGSTLVPRIVFYQSCLKNIDSWGIWGLGVYTNVVSKQWYQASGNRVVASLTHSHNSYLQYWMLMGVVGLVFILSWFVYPVKSMICSKKYSFLALSLLVAFFIDSNFEVLLIVNDALPVVMFFLMMFYVFRDQFYALEHESD